MFVRLMQGACAYADTARLQWDDWVVLARAAPGWLGSTGGISSAGTFLLLSRYESQEAARHHADTAPYGAWLAATPGWLDEAPTIRETGDVSLVGDPEPLAAGFLQIMRARVVDREGFEAVEEGLAGAFTAHRPDFTGGYRAWLPDDEVWAVDYFTSEADARAGEARPPPEDLQAGFEQWTAFLEEVRWHDVADPWIATAT